MSAPESFEQFVVARTPALLRTAYLLTGDHHDAEDLLQTALVRSVAQWRRIEASPEPYVRRVLVNESISRWRRRRWREQPSDDLPETGDPAGRDGPGGRQGRDGGDGRADATLEDRLALRQALARLAPRQRTVIVLRYYEDLTERETAELMGTSVGTVKSQARDAMARLRAMLPEGEEVGTW